MSTIYNILILFFDKLLPLLGFLSPKLRLFVDGRKSVFETLKKHFPSQDQVLWFHCASLGEYEQGVPVLEKLKERYLEYKVIVTFFSPSGYEAKKKSTLADQVIYLPIDTQSNARKFVEILQPKIAVFVKYEFWPNYIKALQKNNIPVVMISAVFRKEQSFFSWYGGFMRKILFEIDHFFVQDHISKELLNKLGLENVTVSGDTRFDRVFEQTKTDNQIDFISEFIKNRLCIVIGSSWSKDEEVFVDYINEAPDTICFIVAPHEIKNSSINALKNKLHKKTVCYSEMKDKTVKDKQVFVLDTIGYLSRVYSYADVAYVGGAMGTSGLHNILEPAAFGIPIIIGKNFSKFREAKQLQSLQGLFSISTANEFSEMMNKLVVDHKFREKTGTISGDFVYGNTGATQIIVSYLVEKIKRL